jgi:hypothetical protein
VTQTPTQPAAKPAKEAKGPSTYQRKKAVSDALKVWDRNQKAAALDELLEDWLHTFPKGEVKKVTQRLSFLSTRFGTPMERKDRKTGKPTNSVRRKSLAGVLQELVSFVLSGADNRAAVQEFGVLDQPENEKVVSALTDLAQGGTDLVTITRRDYDNFQKVLRLFREQGNDFKLPDGATVKGVVGEYFPDGLAMQYDESELTKMEERAAKNAEKAAKADTAG